jgi:hypothetical protein
MYSPTVSLSGASQLTHDREPAHMFGQQDKSRSSTSSWVFKIEATLDIWVRVIERLDSSLVVVLPVCATSGMKKTMNE